MCLRLPLAKPNLTQVLLVGHQLAGDAQGSPLLSPVWILAGVGLGCKRQVPTLPVFSLCISHGCFPRYMVSQHWGHEGCTERGVPLCRFFISLAIADTWISPGKSRAGAELGRRRWWNNLVHLSFDSAKQEKTVLQCCNSVISHRERSVLRSILQGSIYKVSQGEWQGRTRGAWPGMRAALLGKLGMETWVGKTHPWYGPAENPGADITKLPLSV